MKFFTGKKHIREYIAKKKKAKEDQKTLTNTPKNSNKKAHEVKPKTKKNSLGHKDYGTKECDRCNNEFQARSNTHRFCSDECYRIHNLELVKQKRKEKEKENIRKHFEKNKNGKYSSVIKKRLKKRKYKVTDARVMNYDSPTGKAYIGIAKKPLMPAVGYYGFEGVLIQTDNREFVQCHMCGKWFRSLNKHVQDKHNTNAKEYRKEFGLNITTALIPDSYSYAQENNARKSWQGITKKERKRRESILRATGNRAREKSMSNRGGTREKENAKGTCPEQLKFRLLEYIKQYKDLPSRSRKGDGGKVCKVLYRRFGSLNDGFKHYGLPARYRYGTRVEMVAPNQEQLIFNYNKDYNKQEVFAWMLANCPVLKSL